MYLGVYIVHGDKVIHIFQKYSSFDYFIEARTWSFQNFNNIW